MYRKRTNQLKRMKTTENIKLHIIHCKLVYLFALVWLLFSFNTHTLEIWKIFECIKDNATLVTVYRHISFSIYSIRCGVLFI